MFGGELKRQLVEQTIIIHPFGFWQIHIRYTQTHLKTLWWKIMGMLWVQLRKHGYRIISHALYQTDALPLLGKTGLISTWSRSWGSCPAPASGGRGPAVWRSRWVAGAWVGVGRRRCREGSSRGRTWCRPRESCRRESAAGGLTEDARAAHRDDSGGGPSGPAARTTHPGCCWQHSPPPHHCEQKRQID